MSLTTIWPVNRLRISGELISLSIPSEDDLAELAQLAAKGVYDPVNRFIPRAPVTGWNDLPSPEAERAFLTYYWSFLTDWRPDKWNLIFAARTQGFLVGVQEIGAQDFSVTRTVSTGSWIGLEYQRHGFGKAMRQAILHFAFNGLNADRADTSAWSTNTPSLTVSRSAGYRENGTIIRSFNGEKNIQINLTLERDEWRLQSDSFVIDGLTPEALEFMGALTIA